MKGWKLAHEIFLVPLERARAETGGADQWALKRRECSGFARVNKVTSASLGYPLSVFNKNCTLKNMSQTKKKTIVSLQHAMRHSSRVDMRVLLCFIIRDRDKHTIYGASLLPVFANWAGSVAKVLVHTRLQCGRESGHHDDLQSLIAEGRPSDAVTWWNCLSQRKAGTLAAWRGGDRAENAGCGLETPPAPCPAGAGEYDGGWCARCCCVRCVRSVSSWIWIEGRKCNECGSWTLAASSFLFLPPPLFPTQAFPKRNTNFLQIHKMSTHIHFPDTHVMNAQIHSLETHDTKIYIRFLEILETNTHIHSLMTHGMNTHIHSLDTRETDSQIHSVDTHVMNTLFIL